MSSTSVKIIALLIIFLDIFMWRDILAGGFLFGGGGGSGVGGADAAASTARDYFLDVGQGDSELVVFPGI